MDFEASSRLGRDDIHQAKYLSGVEHFPVILPLRNFVLQIELIEGVFALHVIEGTLAYPELPQSPLPSSSTDSGMNRWVRSNVFSRSISILKFSPSSAFLIEKQCSSNGGFMLSKMVLCPSLGCSSYLAGSLFRFPI